MQRREHYEAAEQLLARAEAMEGVNVFKRPDTIACAQVHATLACAPVHAVSP